MKDIDLVCITVDIEYERTKRKFNKRSSLIEHSNINKNIFYNYDRTTN